MRYAGMPYVMCCTAQSVPYAMQLCNLYMCYWVTVFSQLLTEHAIQLYLMLHAIYTICGILGCNSSGAYSMLCNLYMSCWVRYQ
jgi:hypothetical protein